MAFKLIKLILIISAIDYGQSDQASDLEKVNYQLGLMKTKMDLYEKELAQMNKTIESKINNENNNKSGCDKDWISYSDTKCYKVLGKKGSEVEAKGNCSQLDSSSTLITIESKEEQIFLSKHLKEFKNISDFVWIGLEFIGNAFKWMDGKEFKFENWGENAQKDGKSKCVQMFLGDNEFGKWTDDLCERKFQIVCQKKQSTETVLSEEVKNLTKVVEKQQLSIGKQQQSIEKQQEQILSLKNENQNMTNFLIPIGFIYTQLSGQSEPHTLWPQTKWSDISTKYAGLFFRAQGGGSSSFGETQSEQMPRLKFEIGLCKSYPNGCDQNDYLTEENAISVTNEFNKQLYFTGDNGGSVYNRGMNFKYTTDEIRPRNQAIRIWIRIK